MYWSGGLPIAQHANTTPISDQYAYATITTITALTAIATVATVAAVELTIKPAEPAFSTIRSATYTA
jgi:hypothetical protein